MIKSLQFMVLFHCEKSDESSVFSLCSASGAPWTDPVVHGAKPAKITGWLVVEHCGVQVLLWFRFGPFLGRKRGEALLPLRGGGCDLLPVKIPRIIARPSFAFFDPPISRSLVADGPFSVLRLLT